MKNKIRFIYNESQAESGNFLSRRFLFLLDKEAKWKFLLRLDDSNRALCCSQPAPDARVVRSLCTCANLNLTQVLTQPFRRACVCAHESPIVT